MARPEKPIDADGGVVAEFAKELRKLRTHAGNPTYREMARTALFSASVLSSAASGMRLPTLQVTLGFAAACGGDREEWRRRWMEAATVTGSTTPARGRYRDLSKISQELPPPAQLPLRHRSFIDRSAELERLCRAPAATPMMITGPVGAYKSDFAVHYGHRLADMMVDGQLYADLGPLTGTASDVGSILDGFLRALQVSESQLSGTVDQRASLYRSILADRKLLVLLDNVRDEQQVRPLLTESRHSVTVLVSRTSLPGLGDVRRVRLGALSRADSLSSITSAMAGQFAAELEECELLAELCCDLPLALDIALRKLAAQPNLPLHRINAWLADPEQALSWLSIGDLSLRASLNSAYRAVGGEARTFLGHIARLPFPRDLEPITCKEGELVEELAEAGLLHRGRRPGTYRLVNLVRALAIENDVPKDEHTVSPVTVGLSL